MFGEGAEGPLLVDAEIDLQRLLDESGHPHEYTSVSDTSQLYMALVVHGTLRGLGVDANPYGDVVGWRRGPSRARRHLGSSRRVRSGAAGAGRHPRRHRPGYPPAQCPGGTGSSIADSAADGVY